MELTERHLQTMDEWRFCPMANFICPTARETKNEANTPRGLALSAYLLHKGRDEFAPSTVRTFYECSLGGLCRATALDASDVPALVRAVRAAIVHRGKAPQEVLKLRERLMLHQALDPTEREGHISRLESTTDAASTLYVATPWFSTAHRASAESGAELLKQANVDFILPSAPLDSGALLFELGFVDEARSAAEAFLDELNSRSITRVIFASAYDLRAVKIYYADMGLQLPDSVTFESLAEALCGLLIQGRIQPGRPPEQRTAIVDVSYLVYEVNASQIIREIVSSIVGDRLVDLRWSGQSTRYCGGAGLQFLYPSLAERVIKRNVGELLDMRACELLVCECPFTVREIGKAGLGIPITDLASMVLSVVRGDQ